jgi:hypothetical protein
VAVNRVESFGDFDIVAGEALEDQVLWREAVVKIAEREVE